MGIEKTKIVTSNGLTFDVVNNIVKSKVNLNGENVDAITLLVIGSEAEVKEVFTNPDNLLCITEYGKDRITTLATFNNYTKIYTLSKCYNYGYIDGNPVISVTLTMATNLNETVSLLIDTVTGLRKENAEMRKVVESNNTTEYTESLENLYNLDDLKDALIKLSKSKLEDFLSTAIIQSTIHASGDTTVEYSISESNQTRLRGVIELTKTAIAKGNTEFKPYWHSAGQSNTYDWSLDELESLSLEIECAVSKLVTRQQAFEDMVNSMNDRDTLISMGNNLVYTLE